MVATAVDLKGDTACGWMAHFSFLPFHDFDAVDPSGYVGRIPGNAGAEFVPLTMAPEMFPGFREDGQGNRSIGVESNDFGSLWRRDLIEQHLKQSVTLVPGCYLFAAKAKV